MNYSARAAQQQVGRFVADEISYLLRAGEPSLFASERLFWRVPVLLALPATDLVGEAGTLDVDVETGQMAIIPEQMASIARRAEDLARRASSAVSSASTDPGG